MTIFSSFLCPGAMPFHHQMNKKFHHLKLKFQKASHEKFGNPRLTWKTFVMKK